MFDKNNEFELEEVRDLGEFEHPYLYYEHLSDRWSILSYNQSGYDATTVDLFSLIDWIDNNRSEIEKYR